MDTFVGKVELHLQNKTAKNGVAWPKDPLERFILAWLECKSDHSYSWPRWAAAEESAQAAYAYFEHVWTKSN